MGRLRRHRNLTGVSLLRMIAGIAPRLSVPTGFPSGQTSADWLEVVLAEPMGHFLAEDRALHLVVRVGRDFG